MILSKIKPVKKPQHGDYKIEKHFAWWPVMIDGNKIWLEKYQKVYEFKVKFRRRYYSYIKIDWQGTWGEWELIAVQRITRLPERLFPFTRLKHKSKYEL